MSDILTEITKCCASHYANCCKGCPLMGLYDAPKCKYTECYLSHFKPKDWNLETINSLIEKRKEELTENV